MVVHKSDEVENEFSSVGSDATATFERVGTPEDAVAFANSEHLEGSSDGLELAPAKTPKVVDPDLEEDEDEDEDDDLEEDDDDELEDDDEDEEEVEDDTLEDDDLEDDEDEEDELEDDDDDLEDDDDEDEEEEEDPVVAPAKGAKKKK